MQDRLRVLDNEETFQRLVSFLLDSPQRYHWFGPRFVLMPDHLHLIAHQGYGAIHLGQWVKALKALVGGLRQSDRRPVGAPGLQSPADAASGEAANRAVVGRVPPRGVSAHPAPVPSPGDSAHPFTRIPRSWRWQSGFHDHKLRTRDSEARKWEYVCLNPVRYHLVQRPEDWPYGGEVFHDEPAGPRLIRGTPPLLDTGILVEEDGTRVGVRTASRTGGDPNPPREGTRPTS